MAQAAAVFKVNIGILIGWRKRYRATGDVKTKFRCPVNKKNIPEKFIKYIKEYPPTPTSKKSRKSSAVIQLQC